METPWPLPDVGIDRMTPRELIRRLKTIERRLSNAKTGREEVLKEFPQMVDQLEAMKTQVHARLTELRERGEE